MDAFARPATAAEIAPRLAQPALAIEAIQQLRRLGLLVRAGQEAPLPAAVSQTLAVWLHMTERCNLSCAYCYVPQGGRVLSVETGRAALQQAFASAARRGLKAVHLKYAGGEPSLRFATVLALDDHAQRLAGEAGTGLERVLLSNGYAFTPAMAVALRERQIRLMISLDGLGPYQDGQRRTRGGRPTSGRVLKTLDLLKRNEVKPHISITLSRRNLAGLPELVRFLLEQQYTFHLNFFRENPSEHASESLQLGADELVSGLREAYAVIAEHLPAHSLAGALLDRVRLDIPHEQACGAGQNYVVVRPDGGLAGCQMLEHSSGSLFRAEHAGDLITAAASPPDELNNLPAYRRGDCARCFWQFACAGGCALLAYRASGRWDAPSPYCSVYRQLIPDVLRLEGLRLLKQQRMVGPGH